MKKSQPKKQRNPYAYQLAVRSGNSQGKHHTRSRDVAKGRRRKGKYPKVVETDY